MWQILSIFLPKKSESRIFTIWILLSDVKLCKKKIKCLTLIHYWFWCPTFSGLLLTTILFCSIGTCICCQWLCKDIRKHSPSEGTTEKSWRVDREHENRKLAGSTVPSILSSSPELFPSPVVCRLSVCP